jgi:hypothetical protein
MHKLSSIAWHIYSAAKLRSLTRTGVNLRRYLSHYLAEFTQYFVVLGGEQAAVIIILGPCLVYILVLTAVDGDERACLRLARCVRDVEEGIHASHIGRLVTQQELGQIRVLVFHHILHIRISFSLKMLTIVANVSTDPLLIE